MRRWWPDGGAALRQSSAELFVEGEREREQSGEGFGVEREMAEMAKSLRASVFNLPI